MKFYVNIEVSFRKSIVFSGITEAESANDARQRVREHINTKIPKDAVHVREERVVVRTND